MVNDVNDRLEVATFAGGCFWCMVKPFDELPGIQSVISGGRFKKPIVTEIVPASVFYPAEEAHQRYYRKNPYEYKLYVEGSGREKFLEQHWRNKGDIASLRKKLSDRQFEATQNRVFAAQTKSGEGEAPWPRGLYVDIFNGDPLFSSADRFDSGTGWPSFKKPVDNGFIRREAEIRGGVARTAVVGRISGAFIGYEEPLTEEKAEETGVRRFYRVNPDSVRFVPADTLEREGYSRWSHDLGE